MKNCLIILVVLFFGFSIDTNAQENKIKKRPKVEIITPYGNMIVELYNRTPRHRDNFLKLVRNHFYDSLLFHRVIEGFMIQGGDPESKNAKPHQLLGNGGPGYTIDAEIVPGLIHRKGALAAAREGDRVNPLKKSSGSQFYIVQGKVIPNKALDKFEQKMTQRIIVSKVNAYIANPKHKDVKHLLDSLQKKEKYDELNKTYAKIESKIANLPDNKPFKFTKLQRSVYSTVGGTPHLDGNYTVFGQVVKGLNVIDSIANQKTDKRDRPLKDIRMKMKIIDD